MALERLLAWSEIARSPQLAKFLDYIVRRTLDGDEQSIKAYSIAVDVLGRNADFDPQTDPIVRVQARRLRGLLDDYYRGPGSGESARISLPVGRYVPEFISADAPAALEMGVVDVSDSPQETKAAVSGFRGGGVTISWFALVVLAAGIAAMAFAISTWGPRQQSASVASGALQPPSVTIVEFQNLAGPASGGPMVAGLAIELVTDLEQFEDIEVRYGGGGDGNIPVTDLATSDYMLTGIVRPDGLVVQYSAILTDSATGSVVWNHTIPIAAAEAVSPDVLDHVSRSLSLVLGSPRGPLHATARQLLTAAAPLEGGVNVYLCRMLFDLYRETGMAAEAERTAACISALPETDRQSAIGLAMVASLTSEYANPADTAGAKADRFRIAEASLDRAIGLSPISGFVWEQHARLREAKGEVVAARTDYGSSIQLNPANADALAAYARLLAFGGNLGEAEQMARDAADGTPNAPAWYYGVPALLALRDAQYDHAIECAELYAQADRELGPILAILAGQSAGDGAVVNRYLPQVLDMASFRSRGVLTTLRDRIEDDALMEQIRGGLIAAGVPANALISGF
jgi:tetratricopeptide (TPR) repeat protein/TolB-like protein